VVEVVMVGRQLDEAGASVLQLACDQRREEIVTVITDWLADDPLLGFGDRTVDWAEVSLIQRSGGPTDNGAGSRAVIEITYNARLLARRNTMRVQYIGTAGGGVQIATTGQLVAQGEVVDVADELGALLCEQDNNWQPAAPAKKPAKGEE
jgi:hypothetical protein